MNNQIDKGEIIIYQADNKSTQFEVRIDEETVWLSQAQMVELFSSTKQNISLHINNIFKEGELTPTSTVKDYLTVQLEGKRKVQRKITDHVVDHVVNHVTDTVTDTVTDNRLDKILKLIAQNDQISAAQIAKLLNITSRTVKRDIEKLKKLNKLKRAGSEKGGHWEITK